MGEPPDREGVEAEREPNFLLARRAPFPALAGGETAALGPSRRPHRAGVLAASGSAPPTSSRTRASDWLWVASALLVVQWFGDSLDGTLARVRGIQRPKYGYYLDHFVDAIATAAIGIGLGLSPSCCSRSGR